MCVSVCWLPCALSIPGQCESRMVAMVTHTHTHTRVLPVHHACVLNYTKTTLGKMTRAYGEYIRRAAGVCRWWWIRGFIPRLLAHTPTGLLLMLLMLLRRCGMRCSLCVCVCVSAQKAPFPHTHIQEQTFKQLWKTLSRVE